MLVGDDMVYRCTPWRNALGLLELRRLEAVQLGEEEGLGDLLRTPFGRAPR